MQQFQETPTNRPPDSLVLKKPHQMSHPKPNRVKFNQILYYHFSRYEFDTCKKIIEEMHSLYGDMHDFANFVKALIQRMNG